MTYVDSIILGILQGLTEFLPVSSSGHLTLVEQLLGHKDVPLLYDIIFHVASLLAVLIYFRKKVGSLAKGVLSFNKWNEDHQYFTMLFVSSLVTGALVFVNKPILDILRERPLFLSFAFLFTAILLFTAQWFLKKKFEKKEISLFDAIFIGFFQGIAVLPGVSRSGSTITAALFRKISANDAVEYSFMLAIPAIIGALLFELLKGSLGGIDPVTASIGFAASFVTSMAALKFLVFMIKRTVLYPFGIYLLILAGVIPFLV
ncbi:MAG: undecaprenyl-diphosphate phosphatase [bacterium]